MRGEREEDGEEVGVGDTFVDGDTEGEELPDLLPLLDTVIVGLGLEVIVDDGVKVCSPGVDVVRGLEGEVVEEGVPPPPQ